LIVSRKLSKSFSLLAGLLALSMIYGAAGGSRSADAAGLLALAQTPAATCAPGQEPCGFTPLPEPRPGQLDQAAIAQIDLTTYPAVPEIPAQVSAIYQEGLRRGNNPRTFSKVGDCMTATPNFLIPIASGDYDLGSYTSLKKVIDYFAGVPVHGTADKDDSFSNPGLAAASGFNAPSVLDPTWADPKWCKADESPLACEYHVSKPEFALIMFGTNDLKSITPEQYDFYLRRVVVQTINAGIVPILSTFPAQPGMVEKSILYNQVTVKVAVDYHIPLINLWLALKPLPNQGVDPVNTTHMTKPQDGHSAYFTTTDLQAGYNVRNLLTLQALEAVLKVVAPDALK
jgi:hypothetical protein